VEILEQHCPTYHIRDAGEFENGNSITHFNQWDKEMKTTENWLPTGENPPKIALTSGASCPDVLVDEVLLKILDLYPDSASLDEILRPFEEELAANH
jgi:4-hydroxy-3-methylbut-2-enyl diphosphate reductase